MIRSNRHRRGITVIIAVTLLALVAAALVGVGQMVRADAQRSNALREDAQLRLLLLAGQVSAQAQLNANASIARSTLQLPDDSELTIEPAGDDAGAVVRARVGEAKRVATFNFSRVEHGRWVTASTSMP